MTKFSKVAPKLDLTTCFSYRLRAILSSYEIKLLAQCDSELKDSTFVLNLHIDAEFVLRDTGRCDCKKILHDPTNDNFSVFFLFTLLTRKIGSRLSL